MATDVLLLNGPNLNMLGTREPEKYGKTTLSEVQRQVGDLLDGHGLSHESFQSNHEGALIDWLHERRGSGFLIFNPGAFTHTSIALRDAVLSVEVPLVEVHISNVHQREEFRKHSYFSDIAVGSIVGLGVRGYLFAAEFAVDHLKSGS